MSFLILRIFSIPTHVELLVVLAVLPGIVLTIVGLVVKAGVAVVNTVGKVVDCRSVMGLNVLVSTEKNVLGKVVENVVLFSVVLLAHVSVVSCNNIWTLRHATFKLFTQGKKINLPNFAQLCKDVYYSIHPYTLCVNEI